VAGEVAQADWAVVLVISNEEALVLPYECLPSRRRTWSEGQG